MNRCRELMVGSMNRENTGQLYVRCTGLADFAFDLSGTENNLGIFCRLQNLFVHALVAGAVPTIAAGRVDDNFSASFPGFRIEMYGPTLQRECAVDGVQRAVQRPMHFCLDWVERENNFWGGDLSCFRRRQSHRCTKQSYAENCQCSRIQGSH